MFSRPAPGCLHGVPGGPAASGTHRPRRDPEECLANHKSAKKRVRQSRKRQTRNRHQRSRIKTAVKRVQAAVAEGDAEGAPTAARNAESVLRRAASKGVIPKTRASRLVSRLARRAQTVSS